MGRRDPRVEAYIGRSQEFARPILRHLRAVVHGACPGVEETIKWGFPHFQYRGMFCAMASFKQHCAFVFYRGRQVLGEAGGKTGAMGQFGRIAAVADLPPRTVLNRCLKRAMALNEALEASKQRPPSAAVKSAATRGAAAKGPVAKRGATRPAPAKRVAVPADLRIALARSAKARAAFDAFSPSHRREYVEWITEAKRDETRARRVATAVAWMAEGKTQNWRYER